MEPSWNHHGTPKTCLRKKRFGRWSSLVQKQVKSSGSEPDFSREVKLTPFRNFRWEKMPRSTSTFWGHLWMKGSPNFGGWEPFSRIYPVCRPPSDAFNGKKGKSFWRLSECFVLYFHVGKNVQNKSSLSSGPKETSSLPKNDVHQHCPGWKEYSSLPFSCWKKMAQQRSHKSQKFKFSTPPKGSPQTLWASHFTSFPLALLDSCHWTQIFRLRSVLIAQGNQATRWGIQVSWKPSIWVNGWPCPSSPNLSAKFVQIVGKKKGSLESMSSMLDVSMSPCPSGK